MNYEVVAAIVIGVLTDEILQWSHKLSQFIVKRNASKLPAELHDRMTEEWLSHLESIPGKIGKLFFAMSLSFAVKSITKDFRATNPDNGESSRNHNIKLVKPPGIYLSKVAELILDSQTYESIFLPTLADMRTEFFEALDRGDQKKQFFIKLRFSINIVRMLALPIP